MSFSVVTSYQTTLASPMSSSQLTVPVNSLLTNDNPAHELTTADIGAIGWYLTIAPGTASEEVVKVTAITAGSGDGGTFTVSDRGLAFYGTSDTVVAGNAYPHNPGDIVILSNVKNVYDRLVDKETDETIDGIKTFVEYPQIQTAGTLPTLDAEFATKKYVDGVAIAGAPDASTTVKGITKLSSAPVSATNPIAVGDTDTRVPTQAENDALVGDNADIAVGTGNTYVTQTGLQKSAENYAVATGTDTYAITLSPVPTSYAAGMTVHVAFTNANTTVATLNVNSLGAKDIKKKGGTALNVGDIVAGATMTLVYQGTYFEIQAGYPVSNADGALLTGGTAITLHSHQIAILSGTRAQNAASGNQTIAHGLSVAPKWIEIHVTSTGFDGSTAGVFDTMTSHGFSDGTTHKASWTGSTNNGGGLATPTAGVNTSNCVYITGDDAGATNFIQYATASFDATNVTLAWTLTGTGTATNMNIVILAHT